MTASEVVELLARFDFEVWVDGGWAVDALLGEQTRPHNDLDLIVRAADVPRLRAALSEFAEKPDGTATNFVLADAGREVDVHVIDERNALGDWVFTEAALAGRGAIGGVAVRCLSAEEQIRCHAQGYEPTENDYADMERLAERFGLPLPPILRR